MNQHHTAYAAHMDHVLGFLEHSRVPQAVSKRVVGYFSYLWTCRYAKSDKELLEGLPESLKVDATTLTFDCST